MFLNYSAKFVTFLERTSFFGESMAVIVGRNEEQAILEAVFLSGRPEFLALYGRRRVGKTYLVRNTFEHTPQSPFFYVTGIKDGTMAEQLSNFTEALIEAFLVPETPLTPPTNWRSAFKILTNHINGSSKKSSFCFLMSFSGWRHQILVFFKCLSIIGIITGQEIHALN